MRHPYSTAQRSRSRYDETVDAARAAIRQAHAERDQALREADLERRRSSQLRAALSERSSTPPAVAPPDDASLTAARREGFKSAIVPLAELIDGLAHSLGAHPDPDDPWFRGNASLLAGIDGRLANLGVHRIGLAGETFDPTRHEAVSRVPAVGVAPNTIVQTLRTGLAASDGEVLRVAGVVVAT